MWFELEEMGLRGWADVQSVRECPAIPPGRGRVVLATVTHYNTFVMDVRLEGQMEPLRPTDRHRLFSITRNDWVPTALLQTGEILRTVDGSARIASIQPWPGAHRVFNLEVETEHSYFAGEAKVLSHNTNPCSTPLDAVKSRGRLGSPSTRAHIDGVATEMERRGWEITGGGGRLPEEYLPGPGGARKGSSFPDITAIKDGRTLRVNTIDTRVNGVMPTTREAANAARIRTQTPGDHLLLLPKPKKP
jgi:hypothetical protein